MSEVLADELPSGKHRGICALSGPNLSREIIGSKPASTVIASADVDAACTAQRITNSNLFRVYTNEDIVGVEFGGALKNIIALAAGVCDGLNYGDNAKAAIITRGLAEIGRLAEAAGANPLTLAGLAGMGDLIATCSSSLSRNQYFGRRLALGDSAETIRALDGQCRRRRGHSRGCNHCRQQTRHRDADSSNDAQKSSSRVYPLNVRFKS